MRRDAVREGDGQAMLEHWALDLIQFSNNGHYKYTILAHQLLFGMTTCGIIVFVSGFVFYSYVAAAVLKLVQVYADFILPASVTKSHGTEWPI